MINIRLTIDQSAEHNEVEIIIKCAEIDDRLAQLIEQLKQYDIKLLGTENGRTHSLVAVNVLYIESIENRSFLYDNNTFYESDLKLYELEALLKDRQFQRISKNMIVNTASIISVRALFNGKFEAVLTTNEKVIVNRHYVKAFKEKFLI